MSSYKQLLKLLIIGFLVFFMVNTTQSLGYSQEKASSSDRQDPTPSVFGQYGKNDWFITAVTITFIYDPVKIDEIQYYLDESWHLYTAPFNVNDDGIYQIPWYWIDLDNQTHHGGPIEFKIDRTGPTVQLAKKSLSKTQDLFTATASDPVSQIEYVEFYLDGEFISTDNSAPFEYTWTGDEVQEVYAIAYNYAGFSEKSNTLTTPRPFLVNHYIMQRFFVLLRTILLRLC
jgi:hypothetical protein